MRPLRAQKLEEKGHGSLEGHLKHLGSATDSNTWIIKYVRLPFFHVAARLNVHCRDGGAALPHLSFRYVLDRE